ncbi:Methyltransferase domain-containing protein [Rhizobium sp. NFR07]|uniref:class I SAM-dependent methyltransferase n=1 Tax=Rhizobium sp. NFR07 TaxID=1566262 RepID=UPI0008E85BFF|nr:class I SAM-dependent methyltransferase [Rhizobium sp. NFR07]SFB62982.1 Methyltransferase domain-containing protein [Rhizobium sp. NFR07]
MHVAETANNAMPTKIYGRITACRSCGCGELVSILDLGKQPLANALLEPDSLAVSEPLFPLEVVLCMECGLLQVSEDVAPEILFGQDYPYYSSFIPALLIHSRSHALDLMDERHLGEDDLVVEIASNDGYLLKNFVENRVPVLGIDPAKGPAEAAIAIGVPTLIDFFGARVAKKLVEEGRSASVMLANNVLAHVNDINDFIEGFAILLAEDGVAEFEFPYVRDLVETCAFDTIYHEHVFYYSLAALEPLFGRHGLYLNDAKKLEIHGGSLRLRVSKKQGKTAVLQQLQTDEERLGLNGADYYQSFGRHVQQLRQDLRIMLQDIRANGKTIAAYGAAAKGATLLNYADLPDDTIAFVVDRNTHKVGKLMPGVRLPIKPVDVLDASPPDYLLILPWNFADEIVSQQKAFHDHGGIFLKAVPHPQRLEIAR